MNNIDVILCLFQRFEIRFAATHELLLIPIPGTRIIYDRSFLLKCRSSPLSNTPPSNLPNIPGVTSPEKNPNKVDGKITEEGSTQVGKENGGRLCT